MGGAVSTGANNDDLVNNLMEANFIKTPAVEKVFRTVDRAFYFLPEFRKAAYRDLAWKHGNLHLSSPCIYSTVLEELDLKPGQSFLNIGSGTGYLSTMVGLILGPYGVNHGIEIHKDVVDYSHKKLDQFKKTCSGVDVFEFCEPDFVVGNGFHLHTDRKYDRIYCGAACPPSLHDIIKKDLKVGGVLIVPCYDDLLKIVRKSQNTWKVNAVLQVSFSTLQLPDAIQNVVAFEETYPPCLQSLCRTSIRTILRTVSEDDDPTLNRPPEKLAREGRRRKFNGGMHLNIPIFENLSNAGTTFIRNLTREDDEEDVSHTGNESPENEDDDHSPKLDGENVTADENDDENDNQCDETPVSSSQQREADENEEKVANDSESRPKTDTMSNNASSACSNSQNVTGTCSQLNRQIPDGESNKSVDDSPSTFVPESCNERVIARQSSSRSSGRSSNVKVAAGCSKQYRELADERCEVKSPTTRPMKSEDDDEDDDFCDRQPKKMAKREKLDSGISEESDDGKISASHESSSYSESTFSEAMDVESDDSDFSDDYSSNETRFSSDFDNSDLKFDSDESKMSVKYRMALEKRIQALPLPNAIKIYLNYDRDFRFPC